MHLALTSSCISLLFCGIAHAQTVDETAAFLLTGRSGTPAAGAIHVMGTPTPKLIAYVNGVAQPSDADLTGYRRDKIVRQLMPCVYSLRGETTELRHSGNHTLLQNIYLVVDFNQISKIEISDHDAPGPNLTYEYEFSGGDALSCVKGDTRDYCRAKQGVMVDTTKHPFERDRIRAAYDYMRANFCKGRAF